jgi:antirestriction protein ArdC
MRIEQATQPAHQGIVDAILDKLEQGVVPWRKPWTTVWLRNIEGWRYRGINVLTLTLAGHSSPYWIAAAQAQKAADLILGGLEGLENEETQAQ